MKLSIIVVLLASVSLRASVNFERLRSIAPEELVVQKRGDLICADCTWVLTGAQFAQLQRAPSEEQLAEIRACYGFEVDYVPYEDHFLLLYFSASPDSTEMQIDAERMADRILTKRSRGNDQAGIGSILAPDDCIGTLHPERDYKPIMIQVYRRQVSKPPVPSTGDHPDYDIAPVPPSYNIPTVPTDEFRGRGANTPSCYRIQVAACSRPMSADEQRRLTNLTGRPIRMERSAGAFPIKYYIESNSDLRSAAQTILEELVKKSERLNGSFIKPCTQ